jgi:nicotinate-nucleotide pyrophosphorylase (carboxylating)
MDLEDFIALALEEDLGGQADHTSHACIPNDMHSKASLIAKESGVIAGLEIASLIFSHVDPELLIFRNVKDGALVKSGDVIFNIQGPAISILTAERLVLNCMQRMSGIATVTSQFVKAVSGTKAKIYDTRKTTPLMRHLEKEAVRVGGGFNHRFGLYDMILIKDNHIDYSGSITNAVKNTRDYINSRNLSLKIEVETRNFIELDEALSLPEVSRIMLDNFSIDDTAKAVEHVNGRKELESSGGINLTNVRSYALTGVDIISVGALTHSVKSLDLSLKAHR